MLLVCVIYGGSIMVSMTIGLFLLMFGGIVLAIVAIGLYLFIDDE